jgi:hypothetical protein
MGEATAERVRMNFDMLIALATAVGTNEKVQRRFRFAVINKLCKIEAVLAQIHVSQLARDQRPPQ